MAGSHRRTAYALTFEIQELAKEFGIERLGFLTLTFPRKLFDIKEAQRRFHSLNTGVLKDRYERAIGVWERHGDGGLHFHLLVVLSVDIQTGFDFEAIARCDYRSANRELRAEWRFWRETAPAYGFGRTELLPVKSTADGIAKYVGKYVAKHVALRESADRGARVVRYIGYSAGDRAAGSRFGWAGKDNAAGPRVWRRKLAWFAASVGAREMGDLTRLFGPRWAWALQSTILEQETEVWKPIRYTYDTKRQSAKCNK